ncbi:MAG: cupin domain-containing protein [Lachnospiraceae bacterium]
MNCDCNMKPAGHGPKPYVANIPCMAEQNHEFCKTVWTGQHLKMNVMSIPGCEETGIETCPNTDQIIRVEQGKGMVKMGNCKHQLDTQHCICEGDCVFVPAGTWHNFINIETCPLKLSAVYAPVNHCKKTEEPDFCHCRG